MNQWVNDTSIQTSKYEIYTKNLATWRLQIPRANSLFAEQFKTNLIISYWWHHALCNLQTPRHGHSTRLPFLEVIQLKLKASALFHFLSISWRTLWKNRRTEEGFLCSLVFNILIPNHIVHPQSKKSSCLWLSDFGRQERGSIPKNHPRSL